MPSKWILEFVNEGKSEARNISWNIVGNDPNWKFNDRHFSLLSLKPSEKVEVEFKTYLDMKSNECTIKVIWEDDNKKYNETEKKIVLI